MCVFECPHEVEVICSCFWCVFGSVWWPDDPVLNDCSLGGAVVMAAASDTSYLKRPHLLLEETGCSKWPLLTSEESDQLLQRSPLVSTALFAEP